MAHDEDRGGVPSASSLERIAHCPSSFFFEQLFPDKQGSDAREGEFMHDVVMGMQSISLCDPEQTATIGRALAQRQEVIEETLGSFNWPSETKIYEKRYWVEKVCSSRIDELLISENKKRALLIDYKFGRNEVTKAAGNLQLKTQAVAVCDEHPEIEKIWVAIISPRGERPSHCPYEYEDIIKSKKLIVEVSERAINAKDLSMLQKGKWCAYCRARPTCPKAWEDAL